MVRRGYYFEEKIQQTGRTIGKDVKVKFAKRVKQFKLKYGFAQ